MKVTVRVIYVLALILAACQVESSTALSPSAPTHVPATEVPDQTPSPLSITISTDISLQTLLEKAKQDLAQRLGVSADSITVETVINQEFSTGAFNCRSSKERIAKEESSSVVSGQSIILVASGRRYEYHASDQTVIFCRPLL